MFAKGMKPYEHTMVLTAKQFIELRSLFSKRSRPLRRLAFLAVGVVCLFSSYTFILGLALLSLSVVAIIMPRFMPAGAASTYRQLHYLRRPLTYCVSDSGMRVHGTTLDFKCDWSNLRVWDVRDGWLILSPAGMQELFFKIDDLKTAGVFDEVMHRAKQNGVKFNSPKAKWN